MKRFFSAFFQFILFFLVFAAGSFLPPFKLRHIISSTADSTRIFYMDGLLLMSALFLLILLIEAARKRIATAAPWTVLAFALALVAGLASKFGFMTLSR